ncbi:MAG: DUF4390 domain-containing protein [Thermodesulfobacteriota bacterium]|nr:DUF4390 domain-containing protein [Thermodesulfobacteriota bacterium]
MKPYFAGSSRFVIAVTVLILVFAAFPASVTGKEKASIENIIIANTRDDLIAYFDVADAFTEKMKQAVLNGIPATFSFYTSIFKPRSAWFDKEIAEKEITSTLKYNSLKEKFTITRPWHTTQVCVTETFDKARKKMTEIDNLKIVSLDRLIKGEKYQLRIKAELKRVTLPLYLHHVLFFVSLWDLETDWHTIDFIY